MNRCMFGESKEANGMDKFNVRVAYCKRNGDTHSLNINWETKQYVKDSWSSGWNAYLEAKLSKDVDDLEAELIRSGFQEVV